MGRFRVMITLKDLIDGHDPTSSEAIAIILATEKMVGCGMLKRFLRVYGEGNHRFYFRHSGDRRIWSGKTYHDYNKLEDVPAKTLPSNIEIIFERLT
jgi:hypothetical protein